MFRPFLERVLQILKEIAEKSADGDYLYRGEPRHYCRVSSSLYRRREEIKVEGLDIEIAQTEMLKSAQEFAGQMDEDDLLAQLQHFGSVTNLIDFTTDFLIALFFACDSKPARDGRVILLEKGSFPLLEPKSPANRVIAQKSVFVRPPKGFLIPDKTISVPHELKEPILEHLGKHHNVRAQTIYNDFHGFIRYHEGHESAYLEIYAAEAHARKREYEAAIDRYSNVIKLNPRLTLAYNNRGNVHFSKEDYDLAIQDYSKALAIDPGMAVAFYGRGVVYLSIEDYDNAIKDFSKAIEMDPSLVVALINRGRSFSAKGEPKQAIQDYGEAIAIAPCLAETYVNRGIVYTRIGDFESGLQDFDKAIELNSCLAEAYDGRGIAYMRKSEYQHAIQEFDRAIALYSNPTKSHSNSGLVRTVESKQQRQTQHFRKLVNVDRSLGSFHYNRGECWLALRMWGKAEADLSKAKSLGVDVVSAFRDEFGSVSAFEERYKVKLPASIVEMLTANGEE